VTDDEIELLSGERANESKWAIDDQVGQVGRLLRLGVGLLALVVVLLVALTLLTMQGTAATDRLVIEQKRETCYARLTWLTPDPTDLSPAGAPRASSARHCEGDHPLTEFVD
jgi:hypothetical protein